MPISGACRAAFGEFTVRVELSASFSEGRDEDAPDVWIWQKAYMLEI